MAPPRSHRRPLARAGRQAPLLGGALVLLAVGAMAWPERADRTAPEAAPALLGPGLLGPGGERLPLLNGVPAAPPIERAAHLGPLPAVVGEWVDPRGDRWYLHADGSATTTRFRTVRRYARDGRVLQEERVVETVHNARLPDAAARALDGGR